MTAQARNGTHDRAGSVTDQTAPDPVGGDPVGVGSGAEVTEDGFLDSRVRLRQPRRGYRAAIDPVFLASAVPAKSGERALDIGAGAGAASILLAWRVEGLRVSGLERDPALLRLAGDNARLNGLGNRVDFMTGDLARPPARLAPGSFDHILANPPYLEAGSGTPSPVAGRQGANMESGPGLADWVRFAVQMVRDKGTVTLIHRADRLDDLLFCLHGRVGAITVFPLWPDPASGPARRVIVQGRKGSKAALILARGLVLHGAGGGFTADAEAVLRGGAPLDLGGA